MKNITLALSLNYSKKFLTPFLKSYEKYCTGTLYLITDIPDKITNYKNIKTINITDLLVAHKIPTNITAFNLKPILFYLFLKQLTDVSNILVTDVDVIFQDDPFKFVNKISNNNFIVCEEMKTFKNCEVNTTWLQVSYPQFLKDLLPVKILNSGVIYGNKETLQDYFKKMAYEMQNILPKCNYPILDQIILNILYYKNNNINPNILTHGNEFIIHMSQVNDNEITTTNFKDNTFLFHNNKTVIVHQYNKKPLLNRFFDELYPYEY